ncbi:hypothetical protein ALC57_07477 [Trachymyrmex cornetzi]|uniref:Uncharacterized protein n=1 Tax=Trachymyrmex cornetzi TaxID=471704 RepID=A0A195E5L4_9HYME|nr:hypothetical protein ALC57_07477 [Trachymyrmex cornetzi]
MCEAKKKKENKRWKRKAEGAKSERQVWEILNRERNRCKGINKEIGMREWEEYFEDLLGVEGTVVRGERGREKQWMERELSREETKVTGNLKDGKAMGLDGIPNKVWKYGGEEMEEWMWRV